MKIKDFNQSQNQVSVEVSELHLEVVHLQEKVQVEIGPTIMVMIVHHLEMEAVPTRQEVEVGVDAMTLILHKTSKMKEKKLNRAVDGARMIETLHREEELEEIGAIEGQEEEVLDQEVNSKVVVEVEEEVEWTLQEIEDQ